jgi:hypothetical protein
MPRLLLVYVGEIGPEAKPEGAAERDVPKSTHTAHGPLPEDPYV